MQTTPISLYSSRTHEEASSFVLREAQAQVDSICFCCCGCVSCFWKSLRIACRTPGAPPHRRPPRRRALRSPSPSSDPSPPPRIPPCTCESPARFPRPRSIGGKSRIKKTYEKDRLEESPFLLRGAFCDVITIQSNDKFSERRHIRGCYEDLPPINILRFMKTASP